MIEIFSGHSTIPRRGMCIKDRRPRLFVIMQQQAENDKANEQGWSSWQRKYNLSKQVQSRKPESDLMKGKEKQILRRTWQLKFGESSRRVNMTRSRSVRYRKTPRT